MSFISIDFYDHLGILNLSKNSRNPVKDWILWMQRHSAKFISSKASDLIQPFKLVNVKYWQEAWNNKFD